MVKEASLSEMGHFYEEEANQLFGTRGRKGAKEGQLDLVLGSGLRYVAKGDKGSSLGAVDSRLHLLAPKKKRGGGELSTRKYEKTKKSWLQKRG